MSPYWLLARDNFLRSAVLDSPEAVEEWIEIAEPGFSITLMHESSELRALRPADYADAEDVIEALIQTPSPDSPHNESFHAIYARGACDIFAVALQKIIGGDLYAVINPEDEKGEPDLIHAGVYDGDNVIDIEGSVDVDTWSGNWRQNGGCFMDGSTGPISAQELQDLQIVVHTPEDIDTATKIAWLIAALSGALDDDMLETYRSIQT